MHEYYDMFLVDFTNMTCLIKPVLYFTVKVIDWIMKNILQGEQIEKQTRQENKIDLIG